MGRNTEKSISKNLISKYSQNLLNNAKQSATDALKTASKRATQKTAEATGDLTGNKTANKVTKSQYQILQRQLKVKPKQRYISPKESIEE